MQIDLRLSGMYLSSIFPQCLQPRRRVTGDAAGEASQY